MTNDAPRANPLQPAQAQGSESVTRVVLVDLAISRARMRIAHEIVARTDG